MTDPTLGKGTRLLWWCFALSLTAAMVLAIGDLRRGPPATTLPSPRSERAVASSRPPPMPGASRIGTKAPAPGESAPPAAAPAEGQAETTAPAEGPPSPETFIAGLIDLLRKGEIEAILSHARPGFVRVVGPILEESVLQGKKEDFAKMADAIQVEIEKESEECFRIRLSGDGQPFQEDLFLILRDGSWEAAAASDLPGPSADRNQALQRLRLLGLCQEAYIDEGLGGPGRPAETGRDLKEGLDALPAYAGALDPALASALDGGRTIGGYRFGRIATAKGFAYFTAPAVPCEESRQTFVIDGSGLTWAKDIGGEHPPADWPDDPEKAGWERQTAWPRS